MAQHQPRKVVYLVRHGQSSHNIAPVYQGEDSVLSEVGLKQAELVAERLTHLPIEALISSPLPRTRQTAAAITAQTGLQAEFSDLFVEVKKPSSIAGKSHEAPGAAELWQAWQDSMFIEATDQIEDSENFEAIIGRARQALTYLLDRPESVIAVVTHGFFLRTIFAVIALGDALTPATLRQFRNVMFVENTSLSVIRYEDAYGQASSWRLDIYNDQAHLAD